MSRAWMPLYVGDYLADTQHLTVEQHGAYFLLILHYWTHGGLPDDEIKLRQIVKLPKRYRNSAKIDKQWESICLAIAPFFQPGWKHKRIDAELEKSRILSEKRALMGSLGGRANRGFNNVSRHLSATNQEAIAKQTVAQSQSHKKERAVGEKGELGITSALAETIKAKGWA